MKQSLSVVIITFNEERNIERCIRSVSSIADEVVVLDSISSDRTQSIARELGAKVVEQPFLGHIEQKNRAIEFATKDVVLSLDADEALSDELRMAIEQVLGDCKEDGYKMNRLTNYCGTWVRHGGWYPDTKLRLFKRGNGGWTGTNPHDRYELSPDSSAGHLKGDLLHYSFYTIEDHLKQIEKFTDIAAQAKYEEGVRSNVIKLMIKPIARFIKGYLLKAGFLDGYHGWVIAKNSSYATYLRYSKLLKLQKARS